MLRWKLRKHQQPLYDFIDGCTEIKTVVKCSRRFGKTITVLAWCLEQALKRPNLLIRFAAPTEKALRKIIKPNLRILLADCPADLKPRWNSQDSSLEFRNGSEWHFAGTDADHVEKLRGTGADIVVVDEAGSHADLEYVDNDVLLPQIIDTGGRMIFISTPPKTPAHYFTSLAAKASASGAQYVRTIVDNTHLTHAQRERIVEAMGGWDSTAVRRELMCEDVTDESLAIVAEYTEAMDKALAGTEPPDPTYETPVTAMDVGFADLHVILFGYYNFKLGRPIVLEEAVLRRATTDRIAYAVAEGEARLWGIQPPKKLLDKYPDLAQAVRPGMKLRSPARWTDVDLRLIADLHSEHGIGFQATDKDDLEAQVNRVRLDVKNKALWIHPRCKELRTQLRVGVWDERARRQFARTKAHGHFDAIAALVYFCRNLDRHTNPYPSLAASVDPYTQMLSPKWKQPESPEAEAFKRIMGKRRVS